MMVTNGKRATRRILIAVALVVVTCAILSVVYFSFGADGLKYAISVVVATYLGFMLVSWIVYGVQRRHERSDSAKTCGPILDAYRETGDVKVLLASYEEWKRGKHGRDLRFGFPQSIVSELVEDGCVEEARLLMGEVEDMAPDDKTREAVREWRDRCERKLAEGART